MKKDDYIKLVTELHKIAGDPKDAPDDAVNNFALNGHTVALAFDESIPDVVFVLADCGGTSLDNDRALLEANTQLPSAQDGYGCYGRWNATDSIVYRAQLPFAPTTKPEDIAKEMAQIAARAVAGLPTNTATAAK
ncbi:hypothetical protein [Caldimonas sp. KR1-144]|uniref:hypothetical protein n=1 Tax=Caldimonas sp. KR1-144 TaxID=3400911 RepID=UPI003C0E00FA